MSFLADTWPFLGAMALVALIAYGALRPYMKSDARKRIDMEQDE
ncbi:MAG: hypothetical protein QNJ09_02830 [Paracoccaceae bacterium]|nr:hypothetical protein [Paracoccaceae bacterium]